MTTTRKNLSIAILEEALSEIKTACKVNALSEIESYGQQLRQQLTDDPDSVMPWQIARYYDLVIGLEHPNIENLHRYWRDLWRSMGYGLTLRVDGSWPIDGSQIVGGVKV